MQYMKKIKDAGLSSLLGAYHSRGKAACTLVHSDGHAESNCLLRVTELRRLDRRYHLVEGQYFSDYEGGKGWLPILIHFDEVRREGMVLSSPESE
ncbi:MAG: hypothetical protein HY471_00425 [Candidatus Sungbacteria bacterium]|nr:hypothetical protein [Candidatus Sungbacteria bacterium]